MSKVYVLNGGCVGDKQVLAVFSSMKKAKDAVKWLLEVDTHYKAHPEDLDIDIFELNGERIDK